MTLWNLHCVRAHYLSQEEKRGNFSGIRILYLISVFGGEAMDLNVGQHCSVASCNVNDLLPIQCLRCKSHFCREHFGIDHHDCSGTSTIDGGSSSEQVSAWVKRSTCSFGDCNKPTLASAFDASGSKTDSALNDALCPQCSEAFCVT